MRETEVPVFPLLSPMGMCCCCGICIYMNKMKIREAFLEDKIKEFNSENAHSKGLEIRWNEGKRRYDRARGGTGVQVNATYNNGGRRGRRGGGAPKLDIRQFDVGLDLVKLPSEEEEEPEEPAEDIVTHEPVTENFAQPPGTVDDH